MLIPHGAWTLLGGKKILNKHYGVHEMLMDARKESWQSEALEALRVKKGWTATGTLEQRPGARVQ